MAIFSRMSHSYSKTGKNIFWAMETGVQSKKIPVSSLVLFPIRCVIEAAEEK